MGRKGLWLYQARNGAIYLANGSQATRLTHEQIHELCLTIPDLCALEGFDYDLYRKAYETFPPAPAPIATKLPETVDCPACLDGAVYPGATCGMWSGLMAFTAKPERCDLCGGTGEVTPEAAAAWEAARLAEEE